jgi:hypothetical protein
MVLLKRNLEGFRVHSYVAGDVESSGALQISKNCIFLNLGFFCCFDSSTTASEQHVCKLVLAMGCYCNEGSW